MTIEALTAIIFVFCKPMGGTEARYACMERIVNCAVVGDGKVSKDWNLCLKK